MLMVDIKALANAHAPLFAFLDVILGQKGCACFVTEGMYPSSPDKKAAKKHT